MSTRYGLRHNPFSSEPTPEPKRSQNSSSRIIFLICKPECCHLRNDALFVLLPVVFSSFSSTFVHSIASIPSYSFSVRRLKERAMSLVLTGEMSFLSSTVGKTSSANFRTSDFWRRIQTFERGVIRET